MMKIAWLIPEVQPRGPISEAGGSQGPRALGMEMQANSTLRVGCLCTASKLRPCVVGLEASGGAPACS